MLIAFYGMLYLSQPVYAQRAGTSIERNNDVHEINMIYKQGKWEEGKKIAEEMLRKNPKDSDMRMLIGKYYLHKKDYNKARFELVKSLEYAPANVDVKHMLVIVESDTKRYSSAICYINELLEINPYAKGLWRKKIVLYRNVGNHVEADRLLKRISQIYPEDKELKKDQSYTLEQRTVEVKKIGKMDQSIEMARKLVEAQPKQPDLYLSVIDDYIKVGEYNQALAYTDRALNQFNSSGMFVQKKIAILEHQQRYAEVLTFLNEQMKRGVGGNLKAQYNYFLLEASRSAKNNDPSSLYGKIFEGNSGNKEAFDYVFQDYIARGQYEEAISTLNKYRKSAGTSKDLDMKELSVYKQMQNYAKISKLTREYFVKYPRDLDLQYAYVGIMIQQAKDNMQDGKIQAAIIDWKEVVRYGDTKSVEIARRGIYNAYMVENRYKEAAVSLDDMLVGKPGDMELLLKKSDLYYKQGQYDKALIIYEQLLNKVSPQERERYVVGYGEFISPLIKDARENYKLDEAKQLTERWLAIDGKNKEALLYIINISYQLKDRESMLRYAQVAEEQNGEDMVFKIKLAEAMNYRSEKLYDSWSLLHTQVQLNPFHELLVNTFSHTTEKYAGRLLKEKNHPAALKVLNIGLHYKDDNKTLKYMKGLAYEGLKEFDSAYYYQKFHEPSLLEFDEFKNHLNYLAQKSFRNNVGISHLRARFGDDYTISTISTVEYSRLMINNSSYIARINYAGRDEGKGVQGQLEWSTPWTKKLSTRIDVAISNKYFAKYALNVAALYAWKPTWEAEVGIGFRQLYSDENLSNLNLGLSKEIEDFRLSTKLSNFLLDNEGQLNYLYNIGARAEYFMGSPKNYLLAVGNVGNSPDIELLNNQLYNSFNVFNTMVGTGIGRLITPNMGVSVMGTWYNFQTNKSVSTPVYRNLYNLYFQFNVAF